MSGYSLTNRVTELCFFSSVERILTHSMLKCVEKKIFNPLFGFPVITYTYINFGMQTIPVGILTW